VNPVEPSMSFIGYKGEERKSEHSCLRCTNYPCSYWQGLEFSIHCIFCSIIVNSAGTSFSLGSFI
jgi:hypothetical protein